MKKTPVFLLFLFLVTNLFSQTIVKLVDETNEKVSPYGFRMINENNLFYTFGFKDEEGFYNLDKEDFDPSKTYYFYLDNRKYRRIKKEIDFSSNDTLILYAEPDPDFNYKPINDSLVVKTCPYYSFGRYQPFEPRNLEEIPPNISGAVTEHLKNKLGATFFRNIYFTRGQVIGNSKIDTSKYYYLGFAFSNEEKGLGKYCSYMKVDDSGNIIIDIEFPDESPYINDLVAVSFVREKAVERNFYKEGLTETKLEFDKERNIFVWKFINESFKPDNLFVTEELIYNAHKGEFIENKVLEGFWIK